MAFKTIYGAGCTLTATDKKGATHMVCVNVQKDSATGEYRARIVSPDFRVNANADYYTDHKNDAIGTAVAMAKKIHADITTQN